MNIPPRHAFTLPHQRAQGFTLIELLIVIAIVGILSLVVILVINPIELLRQSRDVTRLSDLDTLNHALNLYQGDVNINPSFGVASTTYISVVDSSATTTAGTNCAGVGLPALGTGWSYHCAASSTVRNIDGTGWLPVNFASMSFGSPLGNLPLDPTNTTSSGNYYTYTPGGSWELTAIPESRKYRKTYPSTPNQPGAIINGSDLTLSPLFSTSGLVGYWNFDEGAGSTVVDSSGNGNAATWAGTPGGSSGYYSSAKVGTWAGTFIASTPNTVLATSSPSLNIAGDLTVMAWINPTITGNGVYDDILAKRGGGGTNYELYINFAPGLNQGLLGYYNGSLFNSAYIPPVNQWTHVVATVKSGTLTLYANASSVYSTAIATPVANANSFGIGCGGDHGGEYFPGAIDDVRVYNRALSTAEIAAVYNATR